MPEPAQGSTLKEIILLVAVVTITFLLVGFLTGFIPTEGEICSTAKNSNEENCATHNIALVAIHWVGEFLESRGEAVIAVATLVVAFFTFTLWRATAKLWVAGENQLAIARTVADAAKKSADASLLSLRPWLTCKTEIAGPLTYNEDGDARFQFVFEIKNVGHTPATAIQFTPFLTLRSPKHELAIITLQRMAQLNRGLLPRIPIVITPGNVTIEGADLGLVLFPGEVHSIKYTIPIKKAELLKACEDTKPPIFWPVLGGLITYSYALASIRADTAFAYTVEHGDGPVFKLDETIPAEKLDLSRSIFGEGFAT